MGRFAVVLPLEPLATGTGFPVSAWPLHVTVVEPFETEHDAAWVAHRLAPVLRGRTAIRLDAFDRAMFGSRRNVPVTLVHDRGPLGAMRTRLLAALREADVDVARARLNYRPHVTDTAGGSISPGRSIRLGQVALVDLRPPEGPAMRTVVAVWPLGG
ncbi:2'-5' RNA ligase family protein [Agromyces aurantiacus]|uniref:2'-5' RNA ligase family protein n=1 Tax=Agromyces aurantiacus TaxID=165814 RepID=A0ABV9R812_9MICO|nr:2'-5' RNA ligase family protein [Agromyces aurantiacus]MBM7504071.1 2'-5' RNA ligase [Agromyces aurantiacus]